MDSTTRSTATNLNEDNQIFKSERVRIKIYLLFLMIFTHLAVCPDRVCRVVHSWPHSGIRVALELASPAAPDLDATPSDHYCLYRDFAALAIETTPWEL